MGAKDLQAIRLALHTPVLGEYAVYNIDAEDIMQYPVLLASPMSTVAISVPSFTVFTLFALSPLIVVSSLFVLGINSYRKGGYPYSSPGSIMNHNIASCNVVLTFFCLHATFRVIINGTNAGL